MLYQIMKKEWKKLKFYFLILLVLGFSYIGYFWFTLDFSFKTIEPESMMWYRFSILENKPYISFMYLFIIIGVVIALAQFLPEMIRNRVKILAHLPVSPIKTTLMHLSAGIFLIIILSSVFALSLLIITVFYYPPEVLFAALKDIGFWIFGTIIIYIGISLSVLEKKPSLLFIKFLITALFVIIYFKSRYYFRDLLWLLFLPWTIFLFLDSFYSIKQQRLKSLSFQLSSLAMTALLLFFGIKAYQDTFFKESVKYYLFYSPITKDFVYQKNLGGHRFEYGIKGKETFSRLKYEAYLPFVYWKNLDIQGKLPVKIDQKEYDKQTIKRSRLSFGYTPKLLEKKEIEIFPLFNPQSNKGMIKFPEEAITFKQNRAVVYDFDSNMKNKTLSKSLTETFKSVDFTFPTIGAWGKTTNMKPYDLGYFLLDSNYRLFNTKRNNDTFSIKKITYPDDIKIHFIKISENKQKQLAGYMIDSNSGFYLIKWDDFSFKKLDLPNFDHRKMKLQFISNPLYYLVRYSDGKRYYAVVFDKSLHKIDFISI